MITLQWVLYIAQLAHLPHDHCPRAPPSLSGDHIVIRERSRWMGPSSDHYCAVRAAESESRTESDVERGGNGHTRTHAPVAAQRAADHRRDGDQLYHHDRIAHARHGLVAGGR